MSTQSFGWGSWNTTSLSGTVIGNGSTATSGVIDNNNQFGTDIGISCTYATGSPTQGVFVAILETIDGTNYQGVNDNPYGIAMNFSSAGTYFDKVKVHGAQTRQFKVLVQNQSGVQVTVSVYYSQVLVNEQ